MLSQADNLVFIFSDEQEKKNLLMPLLQFQLSWASTQNYLKNEEIKTFPGSHSPSLYASKLGLCVCWAPGFLLSELCPRCSLWLPGSTRSPAQLLRATPAPEQHPGEKGGASVTFPKGCSFLYNPAVIPWTNSRCAGTMHSPGSNHMSLSALQERQPHTNNFTCA